MNDLQHHSKNTESIIAYLSYLRDISRKIISRNGFEKCLINKNLGYAVQFDKFELELKPDENLYDEINNYYSFLQKNHDKKLFIGFGTYIGTRTRIFTAPIITIQCEIFKDLTSSNIIVEPDLETLNLNYDFISALSNNFLNEEDDIINDFTIDENIILENVERLIKGIIKFDFDEINELAFKIFELLKNKISHFENIAVIKNSEFNLLNELQLYSSRPNKNETKKNREKSIFEKDLVFINTNHLFLSLIPDQLSTYEALNSFVQNIKEQNDFKNPVVEKLLINALTDERIEINRENIEAEIQEIIDKQLPISLSNCQIQGLKNAWANEISYIQGPPGTGKSHTISAIVLSAISMNKKVLVLSQKTAALQVVNKKIEPYLTDDDNLLGICYYDTSARKKIKNYCGYLREQTSNSTDFERSLTIISKKLKELKTKVNSKLKELNEEKIKLEVSLENQRYFKELNETFLTELKRFNIDFYDVPKGFKFKRIKNQEKYKIALDRIEKIWALNTNSILSKLFIYKFKEHLKSKFETPLEWINDTNFPYFSKEFIKLNTIYTEVQLKTKELYSNTNFIRTKIKNLKTDILIIQNQILKLKYKFNVFEGVKNPVYQKEIDKFNGMLNYVNSKLIDKRMKEIDFQKILDVIPFWTAEIRHLGNLFPLKPDLFDLIIVDEASQVNLAEILPAFYRGKKICIVGDHKQLSLKASGLNFSLGKNFDELTWEKYNRNLMRYQTATKKKLTVSQASILDFIKSEEYNVILPEVMLDEHFRSLPRLAKYTSKQFYKDQDNPDGKLKIMTEIPEKISIECFQAIKVNGKRERDLNSKVVIAEAEEVVKIIYCLTNTQNQGLFENEYKLPSHIDPNNFTIGVISMIRDQCTKIIELIEEKLPNLNPVYDLMIGTPEEFQGNERDIMIFSLCLDTECKNGQRHYQDSKRLNVATSRAKSFTYFVYSPFNRTFNIIYKYLNYINGNVSEDDFTHFEVDNSIPLLPKLNFDIFESDFEKYVYYFLEKFVKENSNGHNITIHNQVKSCGQKRLDFVLFNHNTKKSVALEVDGSHHFTNNSFLENYTFEHIERIDTLTRAGWNIINTPYHKWYKNGWLSEESDKVFRDEIKRIYKELSVAIF